MIQEIIDTSLVQWGAAKVEAKVILEGDQPWTRRVVGVSTCPQVGSIINEGIWNTQEKACERGVSGPLSKGRLVCNHLAFCVL